MSNSVGLLQIPDYAQPHNYYVSVYYSTQQTPKSSSLLVLLLTKKTDFFLQISKSDLHTCLHQLPLLGFGVVETSGPWDRRSGVHVSCHRSSAGHSPRRSISQRPDLQKVQSFTTAQTARLIPADASWLARSIKNEMRADHRLSAGCLCPGRQQLESSGGLKLLKGSQVIQLFAVKRQG